MFPPFFVFFTVDLIHVLQTKATSVSVFHGKHVYIKVQAFVVAWLPKYLVMIYGFVDVFTIAL